MPRKAVLPTAAPDQEGAVTALSAVVAPAATVAVKASVEPSGSAYVNG